MAELHAFITGRVQMVMYRDFAQRKARGLELRGWVRNLHDGRVELVARGDREVLEKYLAKLQRGSLLSKVERVEAEWRAEGDLDNESFADFLIVY